MTDMSFLEWCIVLAPTTVALLTIGSVLGDIRKLLAEFNEREREKYQKAKREFKV